VPMVNSGSKTIFFAHVPKTGGSSVEEYLIRRFGGPLSMRDRTHFSGMRQRGLLSLATHLTADDLVDFLPADLDYSFAVVRDPLERMFSQYRFQSGVSKTSHLDFSTWLRIMMRCVTLDKRVYQNHIRPQSDLVPDGSDHFRLEDGFENMIKRLDEITGEASPNTTVGHLLKRKHAKIKISRQDLNMIQNYYDADYQRFGYAKRDPENYPSDPLAGARTTIAYFLAPLIVYRQRRHWLS